MKIGLVFIVAKIAQQRSGARLAFFQAPKLCEPPPSSSFPIVHSQSTPPPPTPFLVSWEPLRFVEASLGVTNSFPRLEPSDEQGL